MYWMASQALWRVDPKAAKGLDATLAYDWSPPNVNRDNTLLTADLRFNEPLPLHFHNTMSLGYVRNSLSPQFLPVGTPARKTRQGVEFNALLNAFDFDARPRDYGAGNTLDEQVIGDRSRSVHVAYRI